MNPGCDRQFFVQFKRWPGTQSLSAGIGSAIAQGVMIEKYRERMGLKSELGQGACLHFTTAAAGMSR